MALAPRLLVAFGADRSRFKNAEEVACYVGVAPVTKQSSKSCLEVRRRAWNKYLVQSFHELASAAANWCTWSKAYYKMHRETGMKRHAILRKLAYRWIRILFRVWHTKTKHPRETRTCKDAQRNPVETQRHRGHGAWFESSTLSVLSVSLCFYSLNPFQKPFDKPLNETPEGNQYLQRCTAQSR